MSINVLRCRPGLVRNCARGAGTHNPREQFEARASTISLNDVCRGVWVPAFAGTTMGRDRGHVIDNRTVRTRLDMTSRSRCA
ncbi:hypothetical protein BRAO375_950012 [Bradyrhizobium sp. ORS 375]|nr:hypothetical protein BRAO375_950012 [Bradyrhizobium sp. ORS 375]